VKIEPYFHKSLKLLFRFSEVNIFGTSTWAHINMIFFFWIHRFYYNFEHDTTKNCKFNVVEFTCKIISFSKVSHSYSAFTHLLMFGILVFVVLPIIDELWLMGLGFKIHH